MRSPVLALLLWRLHLAKLWLRLLVGAFRPVEGWEHRVCEFEHGRLQWPIPHLGWAPMFMPWPIEWCLADPDDSVTRGWRGVERSCLVTGYPVDFESGCRCARCAAPLSDRWLGTDWRTAPLCPLCKLVAGRTRRSSHGT